MSTDIAMGEALDLAVKDLERVIDRHFAARRTIRAVELEDGRWCAKTGEDRILFPACPDREVVERFVAAFARHEDRFRATDPEPFEHSVRVDNVVPLRVEA
jgi:hypothetical protein